MGHCSMASYTHNLQGKTENGYGKGKNKFIKRFLNKIKKVLAIIVKVWYYITIARAYKPQAKKYINNLIPRR